MPRRGRDSEEEGGASRKRQRPGLSVQDAEGRSRGLEESRSILDPVTLSFSMKCDATALAGRRDALEAALRKVAAEFDGLDFRLGRTVVGPSDETLQKTLPLVSCENALKSKLSGHEVYCTNYLILLVKNMLCSKLHCQKVLI